MNRLQWNSLAVGDHVLVHDELDSSKPVAPGRVTAVDPGPGSSIVTIRIRPRGERARLVQPRRLTVHLDSGESSERCWRCEAHYAANRAI